MGVTRQFVSLIANVFLSIANVFASCSANLQTGGSGWFAVSCGFKLTLQEQQDIEKKKSIKATKKIQRREKRASGEVSAAVPRTLGTSHILEYGKQENVMHESLRGKKGQAQKTAYETHLRMLRYSKHEHEMDESLRGKKDPKAQQAAYLQHRQVVNHGFSTNLAFRTFDLAEKMVAQARLRDSLAGSPALAPMPSPPRAPCPPLSAASVALRAVLLANAQAWVMALPPPEIRG
jgi:hypothetical protein